MFTLAELWDALSQAPAPDGAASLLLRRVAIDSRRVEPGDLFVAFAGEREDGHDYAAAAFAAGAPAALVSRPIEGAMLLDATAERPPPRITPPVAVQVDDTLAALQALASARRQAHPTLRVVGVTGSVGKTTTKEAIAAVLAERYTTLRSEGNQNNEIGLPLTLCVLEPAHQRAVLEMGMYALGEIAALCAIAQPQVGVVTNVQAVHLERLGTIERIAEAKAELIRALPADGMAVLNGDDPRVRAMARRCRGRSVLYGAAADCAVRVSAVDGRGLEGVRFTIDASRWPELGDRARRATLSLRALGRQAVASALPAVAVGLVEGLDWDEIARGLDSLGYGLRLIPRRGRHGGILLDDTYNASPTSVLAALDLLAEIPGRRMAALGDMLELGALEEAGHREVGRRCAEVLDLLVAVGPRARWIADEAGVHGLAAEQIVRVTDGEAAAAVLEGQIGDGDTLLIKGSRSVGLEVLVSALGDTSEEAGDG